MQRKKILFVFSRSPFEYSSNRDRRQFFIYSVLKDYSDSKVLCFGDENFSLDHQTVVELKASKIKKIFYFILKLQSPRITHFKSKRFLEILVDIIESFNPDFIYVEHILMMQYFINITTKAEVILFNDESNLFIQDNNLRGNLFQKLRMDTV